MKAGHLPRRGAMRGGASCSPLPAGADPAEALTPAQWRLVERLIRQVREHGYGSVTLVIHNGKPRLALAEVGWRLPAPDEADSVGLAPDSADLDPAGAVRLPDEDI